MLAVNCKKSQNVKLDSYIITEPRDLQTVQGLRDEVIRLSQNLVTHSASGEADKWTQHLSSLTRYFRALEWMERNAKGSTKVNVVFKWHDAFRISISGKGSSIQFEKNAVLFNIGAVLSQQARLLYYQDACQGLPEAAKKFQEAAGFFGLLRGVSVAKVSGSQAVDTSPECALLLEQLMLAQAQECFLQRARAAGMQATQLSRLAKQVALYYGAVVQALQAPISRQHFESAWLAHAQAKVLLFDIDAQLLAAEAFHASEEIPLEICCLQEAQSQLRRGMAALGAAAVGNFIGWAKELESKCSSALAKAVHENSMVHFARIPPASDLPLIEGRSVVKPTPPEGLDPSPADPFGVQTPAIRPKSQRSLSEPSPTPAAREVHEARVLPLAAESAQEPPEAEIQTRKEVTALEASQQETAQEEGSENLKQWAAVGVVVLLVAGLSAVMKNF